MGLISRVSSRTYRFFSFFVVPLLEALQFLIMSDLDDHTFEGANEAGALTYPLQCSALRKNGYVLMKGHPCKIVDMSTSKTGKHGHAKVNMVGIDIFDGKKYEDMSPSTHNMEVPNVKRKEYTLIDINEDGYLSLMNDDGDVRDDLNCAHDRNLEDDIRKKFENGDEMMITVLAAMGKEIPLSIKPIGGNK